MLPKSKHIWRPSFCTEGVNQNIIALADDNLTKTLEIMTIDNKLEEARCISNQSILGIT